MHLIDKFYRGGVGADAVVRFKDGSLPTAEELDLLRDSAYIFDSVYRATKAELTRLANAPRCSHCNSLLDK